MTSALDMLAEQSGAAAIPSVADDASDDLSIDSLRLNGKRLTTRLEAALTAADFEWTIEGATTLKLSIEDEDSELLRSQLTQEASRLELDDMGFRLHAPSKNGSVLDLTFIQEEVYWLKRYRKHKKAFRDKITRAQFIRSMVKEVKEVRIGFRCPELLKKQPIKKSKELREAKSKKGELAPGLNKNSSGTVKGIPATPYQMRVIEKVLDTASDMKIPAKVAAIAVMVIIHESMAKELTGGDRDSIGPFQQRVLFWSKRNRRDAGEAARTFFEVIMPYYRKNPSADPNELAAAGQQVIGGGVNFRTDAAGKYDGWAEGQHWVEEYGYTGKGGGSSSRKRVKRYAFSRGEGKKKESTWAASLRLADEVGWRRFMVKSVFHFISEEDMIKQAPRLRISEDSPGIDSIDFGWLVGRDASEATVVCQAKRWKVPPGSVVVLFDMGAADGRWIVSTYSRSLFSTEATVKLKRPRKELPEPAPEVVTVRGKGRGGSGDLDNVRGGDRIRAAYNRAHAIHDARFDYVWGGGHGGFHGPYDCSGAVSAVLHSGDMLDSPLTSGGLLGWGSGGEGKFLTVWTNPEHVFIEFKVSGKAEHFGTGDWGKGWRGAGFNPNMHPKGGFTPRHWPGL